MSIVEVISLRKPGWIDTARLCMRPVSEGDAALFCDLYADTQTMHFVGPTLSRERAQRSFRIMLASLDSLPLERLFLVIVEKASQRPIGIGSLQRFEAHHRWVEAGMVLNTEARGRGFGKEGLRALVTHAFAMFPVDEVWIQHAAENENARRVPISLGLSRIPDTAPYEVAPGNYIWSAYRKSWRG